MTLSLVAVFIPVLFMGGLRRPAVPRVRGHDRRGDPGVGLRLAHADADAVQRASCKREHGAAPRTAGTVAIERVYRAVAERATSARSRWVMQHRRVAHGCSRSRSWSAPSCCSVSMPKGFMPSEDTGRIDGSHRGREGIVVRGDGASASSRSRRSSRRTRTSRRSCRRWAAAVGVDAANQGRLFIRLKPRARSARMSADEVIAELQRASCRRCRASASSCRTRRRSASAAARRRASTSSRCRAPDIAELYDGRARSSRRRCARLPELHGRHERPADRQPAGARRDRPRPRGRARRHRASRSSRRSTTPTARARSRRSTRQTNQYRVIMELKPRVPARPRRRSSSSTCARDNGTLGAARRRRDASRAALGPLTVQPLGPAARRSRISFNLRPGVALGDGRRSRRDARRATTLPADDHDRASPATAQAFQDSAGGPAAAARGRDLRDLPGARHALRELHPPAHDPLGPAVRGVRRAAHAADLRHGPERLRVRRHHHADRPREEERDHDDRLRARGRAQATASRRDDGDLRGVRACASARS